MVYRPCNVEDIRSLFLSELSENYDRNEISEFIYILFNEFTGWSKARFHLELKTELPEPARAWLLKALSGLSAGTPVQYITGKADFNGLTFLVNRHVLIPRPETAELAGMIAGELASCVSQDFSILDIGTGSGCIAVYLKKNLPAVKIFATDTSEEALETARQNSELNNTVIQFIKQDILQKDGSESIPSVNLIVSNPPYVTMREQKSMRMNVKGYEPSSALFVPDDDPLLYYKAIADYSVKNLCSPGILYLEINESFGAEVTGMLHSRGFTRAEVKRDFFGKDRFVRAEFRT